MTFDVVLFFRVVLDPVLDSHIFHEFDVSECLHFIVWVASEDVSIYLGISPSNVCQVVPDLFGSEIFSFRLTDIEVLFHQIASKGPNFLAVGLDLLPALVFFLCLVVLNNYGYLRISVAEHAAIVDVSAAEDEALVIDDHEL
jgi:hypothetical protein